MTFRRDDGGEATVISQLLIIGITAGIVFVAATYAYYAVDTAINEADHSAAQLSLRGATERIESLSQQGTNASTAVPLPQQGDVTFRSFSPPGRSPERMVIMGIAAGADVTLSGLADGDEMFDVQSGQDLVVKVAWHWGLYGGTSNTMGITSSGTYATPGERELVGVVSFHIYDADEPADTRQPLAIAIIADLHTLLVETKNAEGDEAAAMVGNMVLNGAGHVTSQLHVQGTDVLAMRVWALEGASFSASGDHRMRVQVLDQAWLGQAGDLDQVTVQVVGTHAPGILSMYERHGGSIDGDTATFPDATRLHVHGTHLLGELQA